MLVGAPHPIFVVLFCVLLKVFLKVEKNIYIQDV